MRLAKSAISAFCVLATLNGCSFKEDGSSVNPSSIVLQGAFMQPSTPVRFYASIVASPSAPPPSADWVQVASGTTGTTVAFQSGGDDWYLYFASTPTIPSNAWFPCASRALVSESGIPAGASQPPGRCVRIAGIFDANNDGSFTNWGDDTPVFFWVRNPLDDPNGDGRPCFDYQLFSSTPPFGGDYDYTTMVDCLAPMPTSSTGDPYGQLILVTECGHGGQTCCSSQVGSTSCNPGFNCSSGTCCGPNAMPDNTCNGMDEDCDGHIDENYVATPDTDCDGVDDDCDGHVDEGWTSSTCEGATTEYAANCQEGFNPPGRTFCRSGMETCEAVSFSTSEQLGTYCVQCGGACGLCNPVAEQDCHGDYRARCPPNRECYSPAAGMPGLCRELAGCPHIEVPTCWLPEWNATCTDGLTTP